MSSPLSWLASTPIISRANTGTSSSLARRASSSAICLGPLAVVTPNSAAWPRIALISIVRCLTSRSRTPSIVSAACCSAVLTGTNRMVGRLIASQIASTSIASFLPRLTPAFAGAGSRLDVLRRDQQHLVPQAAQPPRPVMRSAARLEADSRRRQFGEEFLDLAAPQLSPQHRRLVLVDAMDLKDMLGRVQP